LRNYIKEIGTHSTIYSVSNILTKAIGIILIPIYTRFLTVEDYGIISIITPIINAFLVFYTFGMRATYGRFFFDNKDRSGEQKKILGMIVMFMFLLGLIGNVLLTFFGKPLFNRLFPGVDFYPYILLGIWTGFLMLTFDMKLNLFRLRQQSIAYGVFSILKFGSIVSLTIFMVVGLKLGALGKVLAEFIICGLFFVISLVLLFKDMVFAFDISKFKELLRYALPILPHNLAAIVIALTAKYYLNMKDGVGAAGIFNIAFLIGSIMNIIITSINLTWNPFFMKTAKAKDHEEASKIFSQLTTYYAIAVVFIGLAIALFSKEAIYILTTSEYYGAAQIAPILVFSYILQGGYYMVVTKIFYIKTATKYLALITVASAVANIVLNALLVPDFGLAGSAWSFLLTTLMLFVITYLVSQRVYRIKYEYRRLGLLSLISVICISLFIGLLQIDLAGWLEILAKLIILFLYLSLLFIFRFLSKSEINNLKDIIQKVRRRSFHKS